MSRILNLAWAALATTLTALSLQPALAADSSSSSAPDAALAPASLDAAQQRRVDSLKKGMPAKLAKKPKTQRVAEATVWQEGWAKARSLDPFDQPQEAQVHFLAKRLPAGQATLGPSDYVAAQEQAARMPLYSTPQGRFVGDAQGTNRRTGPGRAKALAVAPSGLAGSWTAMGPGNIGGRTRVILIHPTTPTTMWIAGVAGGVWKSTDGGANWSPKGDLLVNIAFTSMLLDPRNPDILYAGTGEGYFNGDAVRGGGIMKSTDGGETWAQLPSTASPDFYYVQKIVMSKGSSQRLYAATRTGVFRSTDAGTTWTKMLDATAVNGCMDLAIQTDRALANVFAACGTFAQGTIYRALDTGGNQTWNSVHSTAGMGRTSLAIAPSNQSIIYAMSANSSSHALLAVYRSSTNGSAGSWTTQVSSASPVTLNRLLLSNPVYGVLSQCGFGSSQSLTQGWYDNTLAVDPADPNIVWAGGIDLFRSTDGGQNWGQASHWWFTKGVDPEYNHADHHALAFHPQYNGTSNKIMYSANDGGIHMTADARAPVSFSPDPVTPSSPVCGNTAAGLLSWQELNNGYQVTQFYHGAHYPNGASFFGGTQDNGTLRGTDGAPNAWATIRGGDGGYVALNPNNTNMLWAENTGLSIQRSTNGGSSYSSFTSGITEAGGNFLFITPFAQDPSNPDRMWIGGARLWRTTAATAAVLPSPIWTQSSQFLSARVSAIAVAPQSSDRVYAGTQAISGNAAVSGVVYTTGAGTAATSATVWTGSKPRPGINYVSWITPDPVTAGTVYATISTFNDVSGSGHVFKSTDFGATWTNIDGSGATGIPDVPAHTIVVDPTNNQRLYVGTDIGLFVSVDGGANWARENTGFANVIIEALSIKSDAPRYLYAYTHGRSVFRAPLP